MRDVINCGAWSCDVGRISVTERWHQFHLFYLYRSLTTQVLSNVAYDVTHRILIPTTNIIVFLWYSHLTEKSSFTVPVYNTICRQFGREHRFFWATVYICLMRDLSESTCRQAGRRRWRSGHWRCIAGRRSTIGGYWCWWWRQCSSIEGWSTSANVTLQDALAPITSRRTPPPTHTHGASIPPS